MLDDIATREIIIRFILIRKLSDFIKDTMYLLALLCGKERAIHGFAVNVSSSWPSRVFTCVHLIIIIYYHSSDL